MLTQVQGRLEALDGRTILDVVRVLLDKEIEDAWGRVIQNGILSVDRRIELATYRLVLEDGRVGEIMVSGFKFSSPRTLIAYFVVTSWISELCPSLAVT